MPASGNPRNRGYLDTEMLKDRIPLPSKRRWAAGPVAIIECTEDIPCNPCVDSCPAGAIHMSSLTAPPTVDYQACTGCTRCAQHCPAEAIEMRPYQQHEIDPEKCTRCDTCRKVCPADAIKIE